MKRVLVRVGMVVLALVVIVVAVVLVRLGLAAQQVASTDAPAAALPALGSTRTLSILPLYEEAASEPGYVSGHGVSYLVRTGETTVLMDLGNNPDGAETAPLLANMARAGLEPGVADVLVISHLHPDHTGGLQWRPESFAGEGGLSALSVEMAYLPGKLPLPAVPSQIADTPQVIAPGVATLGRMPFVQPFPFSVWQPLGYEQVLAVKVEGHGLVLITGCGHPTLETIVARAEALFDEPVVGVVGGLHYEGLTAAEAGPHVEFLAARSPELVALSPHDSSAEAIAAFAQAFPAAYRYVEVGEVITFPAAGPSASR